MSRVGVQQRVLKSFLPGLFGIKDECFTGHCMTNFQSGDHYAGSLEYHTKKANGKDSF